MQLPLNYRVLGLDLSLKCAGWSIVDVKGDKLKLVDYGYIDTGGFSEHGQALIHIEKVLQKVMNQYSPSYTAVEQMFVSSNRDTAMKLAQIHGIALLLCAKQNIPVTYYAVMTAKSVSLEGSLKLVKEDKTRKTGEELKDEVKRKMIEVFGINSFIKDFNNDVTDSISMAYTFYKMKGMTPEKSPKKRKTTKKKSVKDKK